MNVQKMMWFVVLIVILATVGLLTFSGGGNSDDHHANDTEAVADYEVYPGEVAEKIARGEDIILLDVRTPEEYEEIHIENALLLPVQQLSQQSLANIGLGPEMKDKEILVYCRSGARSKTAYDIMTSLGYTNVKSIAGGMIHWEEDEYPYTEAGAYEGTLPSAAPEESVSGGPRIAFDRTTHDFGVIPQYGGVVRTEFTVRNEGDGTLEIGEINTSCSCTSARISTTSIPAGNSATLTVVFDPDFHEEPLEVFKRTVFIPTNDPTTPEAEVSITVDIAEGE